jgi:hypothetical protein
LAIDDLAVHSKKQDLFSPLAERRDAPYKVIESELKNVFPRKQVKQRWSPPNSTFL